ncbi:hypothetical protein HYALB_00002430 [Hymenoscyphus albidus]|uniref:Uncharacterized protein n=1 Tax=Hymenoscyphus albidus TaxID=595503 RepID=A0A9N9Q9C9_9HELO|nr:hypothetical protein HYALB_00002430 [Hymenoscyphus albidus]
MVSSAHIRLFRTIATRGLIQALKLASIAGLATPDHISILISVAVQIATNIADEIHSRGTTNTSLDKINDSFFAPRGLIALIISWKPNEHNELVTIYDFDMTPAVSLALNNSNCTSRRIKKVNHKFKM